MPRYTTSQTFTDGNTQIVPLPDSDIVAFDDKGELLVKRQDDEDLEEKLRRISEHVPVRISNTSGSSAGSGSGDFHQYRQMRRREQDRLARMEVDYEKRKEETEFLTRREERMRAAEARTAKKRAKRLKKKENKKLKKNQATVPKDQDVKPEKEDDSSDEDLSGSDADIAQHTNSSSVTVRTSSTQARD